MMDLFKDPQAIPFTYHNQVHLPKLKNQIDRRILKIMAMLQSTAPGKTESTQNQCPSMLSKCVQTQSTSILQTFQSRQSEQSNFLGISNKFNPNVQVNTLEGNIKLSHKKKRKINDKNNACTQKHKERPLREIRPGSILYEQPEFIKQEPESSKPQTSLIESNSFTFKRIDFSRNQSSIDNLDAKQIQEEKIFDKKHFPMKLSCIEMCGNEDYMKNQNYFEFRDNARSEIGRMSMKTDLSRHSGSTCNKYCMSNKRGAVHKSKRKMTDMSFPDSQRIEVSEGLLDRMQGEVQEIVGRRRKEFSDSKVRLNVLKKIEERYNPIIYQN